jgi:hypothetical protein
VEVAHVGIERPRTLCQALAVALVGRAGAEEQAPQVSALEAERLKWPSDSTQAAEVGAEHMQTTRPYKCQRDIPVAECRVGGSAAGLG